jgi:hypothetical protein
MDWTSFWIIETVVASLGVISLSSYLERAKLNHLLKKGRKSMHADRMVNLSHIGLLFSLGPVT